MEQAWNQQREGGGSAMGAESSCHADLDQDMAVDPCEIILLMELMEDLPASSDLLLDGDGDADRQLSHVIRSLEAVIGGAGDQQAAAAMLAADEGADESLERIMEDVLPDPDDTAGYEGASSFEFEYWPRVSSSSLAGHYESEGWCVYSDTSGYEGGGVLGYDDTTADHHYDYFCCSEGPADHMYLPLWE